MAEYPYPPPPDIDWRSVAVRLVQATRYDIQMRKLSTHERDELEAAVEEADDRAAAADEDAAGRISEALS